MSALDYGAIVIKNGKLMNTDRFSNMKHCVGWDDSYKDYGDNSALNGNYFAYIGDVENTICFYKTMICVVEMHPDSLRKRYKMFGGKVKWKHKIGNADCTVTYKNDYYVLKWNYKNDKYKVYFGYGVDIDTYKKWHIVNYYKSWIALLDIFVYKIKSLFDK